MNSSDQNSRPVALITGASAGFGACFAKHLAEKNCDLILVARRENRLRQVASDLEKQFNIRAEILPADLTNPDDLAKVYAKIQATENLEYLINNAGFGTHPLYAQSDHKRQLDMVKLHVVAVADLTHAALPGMIKRKRGNIINVASVAGFFSSPTNVLYCSTKTWGIAFSKSLAIELAGTGVNIQALCPGFTYTEFHDVMKVDRKLVSKFLWLKADFVVNKSLKKLGKGYLCIPSIRYKFFVLIAKIAPEFIKDFFARKRIKRLHQAF